MKREQWAFLLGGFAFGILFGFGLFKATADGPVLALAAPPAAATAPGPAPSMAAGGPAGAPMVAEINALKRHLQEHPGDLASIVRLANLYHDVSMWDQAIEYYEQALEVRPDDPDLLTDLGVCYRGAGEYEKALSLFERAHDANPGHWESLFNTVVVAAFDIQQFERARGALEALEAMDPQPPKVAELRQKFEEARAGAAPQG